MAGITLASVDFECPEGGFRELPPITKGELVRTFDKTLTSTISAEKRKFQITTSPVSKTKYDSMQTAFANGASMTLTGDLLLGDSVTVRGAVSYSLVGIGTADAGYNHLYVLSFDVEEV